MSGFNYDDGAQALFGQTSLPQERSSRLGLPGSESEDVSAIETE